LVGQVLLDPPNGGKLILNRRSLLHHALRDLVVIPKTRIFGLLIQLSEAGNGSIDVKDASSAARPTA